MLRKFARFIFIILNKILFRFEVINKEKLPVKGPAILVANHQHAFDISIIHCTSKPWVYWVAKKELIDKPVLGYFVKRMGVLPVDRKKNDLSVAKSIYEKIKAEEVIGIFPQGTRVKNPEMISRIIPKTGAVHFALKTKVPVIPIGITNTFRIFGKIRVTVGDPIDFYNVPENTQGNNEIIKMTIHMMKEIYKLADIDYKIDNSLLEAGNDE